MHRINSHTTFNSGKLVDQHKARAVIFNLTWITHYATATGKYSRSDFESEINKCVPASQNICWNPYSSVNLKCRSDENEAYHTFHHHLLSWQRIRQSGTRIPSVFFHVEQFPGERTSLRLPLTMYSFYHEKRHANKFDDSDLLVKLSPCEQWIKPSKKFCSRSSGTHPSRPPCVPISAFPSLERK